MWLASGTFYPEAKRCIKAPGLLDTESSVQKIIVLNSPTSPIELLFIQNIFANIGVNPIQNIYFTMVEK